MSIYPAFGYVMLVTRHIISILYCFWAIRFWPHYWKISYIETHIVSDFDTGQPIFRKNIWVDSNSQAPFVLKPLGFVVAELARPIFEIRYGRPIRRRNHGGDWWRSEGLKALS